MIRNFLILSLMIMSIGCGSSGSRSSEQATTEAVELVEDIDLSTIYRFELSEDETNKTYRVIMPANTSFSFELTNIWESEVRVDFNTPKIPSFSLKPETEKNIDYDTIEEEALEFRISKTSFEVSKVVFQAHLGTDFGLWHDPTSKEPNDTMNTAFPIISNERFTSFTGGSEQADWYVFDLLDGDTVTISLTNVPRIGEDIAIEFFDEGTQPSAPSTLVPVQETYSFEHNATESGKFFLNVKSLGISGEYVIDVSFAGITN